MKKRNRSTVLAVVGVILVVSVFIWLGFSGFSTHNVMNNMVDSIHSAAIIEQGDTRIQQDIDFRADNITRKYYIHTYIEVYNNGWKEAEKWHDYATADEILDIKAMRRIQAEEESVKIGKAIKEFYYGKEN